VILCGGRGARLQERTGSIPKPMVERLAWARELRAFRHEGFWECMDTYKDAVSLNDLQARGGAPWKLWR
jgi:glucose-1-phosphate cytidylyltransferase